MKIFKSSKKWAVEYIKSLACSFTYELVQTHRQEIMECSKMRIQSCPEVSRREGGSHLDGGAYGGVCEHDQEASCLHACASKRASARRREAAPAKARNAADGIFQHSQK